MKLHEMLAKLANKRPNKKGYAKTQPLANESKVLRLKAKKITTHKPLIPEEWSKNASMSLLQKLRFARKYPKLAKILWRMLK